MRGCRLPVIGLVLVLLGAGWGALQRADVTIVIHTATVGEPSTGILAVDERTGRTFVLDEADGTLSILETRSGVRLRTRFLGLRLAGIDVDATTGHVIVAGSDAQTISVLDGYSGSVLHVITETINATIQGLAVDPSSARAVIGHSGAATVTLLDTRRGAILAELDTCYGPGALAVSARTHHLFAKCDDGSTAMLDARTGTLLATAPTYGAFGCVRVDERTERIVTLSTDTQQVDLLDARTGRHVGTTPGLAAHACPAIDERSGRIYVALDGPGMPGSFARTSQVAVLDGTSGTVLRRIGVTVNPLALAVNAQTGHVLVVSVGPVGRLGVPLGEGTLSVLDGTRGQVLRRVPVGIAPADVAIDTRARRVLVFNSASDVNGYGLPVTARPPEAWWPQTLRGLKRQWPWLPLTVPAPSAPPTSASITTLDLAGLDGG